MAAAAQSAPRAAAPAPVTGGRLVCLTDGREYTIADILVFGREAGSDVVVENTQVSRRHAEFTRSGTTFELRDLGSLNGTYHDGERVDHVVLRDGAEVQVGKFRLTFYRSRLDLEPRQ